MDDQTSGHYRIRGLNLCCSHKSPVSDSLLDQDLQGERQVSPVSDFHQGEPLLARGSRPHKLRGVTLSLLMPLRRTGQKQEKTERMEREVE